MIDVNGVRWRKSSYSGGGNTCVEVASISTVNIAVRDSTDPYGPVLAFRRQDWKVLLRNIKGDDLD